jgi:hypothetical protein
METGIGVLTQGMGAGLGGLIVYYLLARYFKCPGIPSPADVKVYALNRKKLAKYG